MKPHPQAEGGRLVSRLPELERYQLSPDQTKVYDAVLASRGSLQGPFRVWLLSPEFADRAQRLGEYARYHTMLSPRLRELAILVTARLLIHRTKKQTRPAEITIGPGVRRRFFCR